MTQVLAPRLRPAQTRPTVVARMSCTAGKRLDEVVIRLQTTRIERQRATAQAWPCWSDTVLTLLRAVALTPAPGLAAIVIHALGHPLHPAT